MEDVRHHLFLAPPSPPQFSRPITSMPLRGPRRHPRIAAASLLASVCLSAPALAQSKTFIDYLRPAPIVCSPLSSETWGVDDVLPRDTCNGIESARGAGVPPEYYYWDGQILKATDGKYHMFMSTWSGADGFNPGWTGSDAFHAISEQGVLGPYIREGFVYNDNGSHKGHNVSALELPDGSYAVVVSETVPFNIYRSTSLDGPWERCTAEIMTAPGVNGGSDTRWASNVSLVARHDGRYQIVQRHGLIAISDTLCGPYVMEKPTWKYPSENIPTIDSIYPRRTSIPGVDNPTYAWEEDPHIWRSGGLYHVLYSGSGDRVGWHLYSPDGINDWMDGGLSCSPRLPEKIFGYEESSVVNRWYKMERPGVVLENGRVTHVTWAVSDVDKDNQIPGNSNHGSKVIVVPFDGEAFEADYGGGTGGSGGSAGAGGAAETGGDTGRGGETGSAGSTPTVGGGAGRGGETGSAGSAPTAGGDTGEDGTAGTGGRGTAAGGSMAASGGSMAATGGRTSGAGGTAALGGANGVGGRSSSAGGHPSGGGTSANATGGAPASPGGTGGASGGRSGVSVASGGSSTSGGVGSPSTGGSSSIGASATGGSSGTASADSGDSSDGCSCRLGPVPRDTGFARGLLLGGLGLLMARRRNRSRHVTTSTPRT